MLTVTLPDDDHMTRLADLGDQLELVRWDLLGPLPADVLARVDVVVIGHYWIGSQRWERLATVPNLRCVLLPSAGFEHALPYIPEHVSVCSGRGVHSAGTAELAVALMLAAQRGLADAVVAQSEGRWHNPFGMALADRRVLVVGAGSVASALVARLRPFEVQITQVARTARVGPDGPVHGVEDLATLLPDADIVVLTVPLDASTEHLLDAAALAALPDGALVVNVARGRVVDTDALLAELCSGRLRAALDVTDPEPLPPGHPLWSAPNTVITAHQGGNTDATSPRVTALVRRQLGHLLAGEPLENQVR
ncbi:MAG: 2-hydroxyacid dehydrogenase [Micrococcales bacterium]|nr:2-hydroxyacid dehydrogenase [Micrococcales bacterium]MCL2668122.1 2-hydroxyacid dehydrogenase [Micrococcales bacterium]